MANFGTVKFLISLGTNLGDRHKNLTEARDALVQCCGMMVNQSSVYETAPWGFETHHWFLNQVVVLESGMQPMDMLKAVNEIESKMGRERLSSAEYQSRILDIDILMIEQKVVHTPELTVPHPRMHERKFVLIPAAEIAANWRHPVFAKTVQKLLVECSDNEEVRKV